MAGIKLATFLGTAPKISPELLPNTAGQVARNCKLYSGDLLPYPAPVVRANAGRTGTLKTIFPLRNPDTNEKVWMSWLTDVDVVVASKTDKREQRFYFSGDGSPQVSNYELAAAGTGPYPAGSYDLGLPVPPDSQVLTTTAAEFSPVGVFTFARDANNKATLVTTVPHGLRSGNSITVSGFTRITGTYDQTDTDIVVTIENHGIPVGASVTLDFTSGDAVDNTFSVVSRTVDTFTVVAAAAATTSGDVALNVSSFNASNVECTVEDDTTLTYFSPGFQIATREFQGVTTTFAATYVALGPDILPPSATTRSVRITKVDHELVNGQQVSLNFDAPYAIYSGSYTISVVNDDEFIVVLNARVAKNSGDVDVTAGEPASVDLGGLTQARSYVFTWYTPWDEESIASKPSDNLYIKEGVQVTVTDIPTTKPAGSNFVRGVRLYRTLAAASGTEYYRLATLWFPNPIAQVQRTFTTSQVKLLYPHNLGIDDRFKISGCSEASFDIVDGVVTDIIDDYTFAYEQVAGPVSPTQVLAGTLYYDISENPPESDARYWGDGGVYSFIDDFDSRDLFDILDTDDYDAPPADLQGLTVIQNNIMCGFVGNTIYFSVPAKPHAWPAKYALNLEHNVVGLVALGGSLLVLTDAYPYLVSGSDPENGMSPVRIDANFPCLSKQSIVTMSYGVVYSTHDGLAVYSSASGPTIITKALYNNDTWKTALDPTTIVAEYYGENYFASHAQGSFVFEQDQKVGGFFVDCDFSFTASHYDAIDGVVYCATGTNGDIYEWDDLSQSALTQEWKSKVIVTKDYINLGAARVIADYESLDTTWNALTDTWEDTEQRWDSADAVTFKLWVDKDLIFTTELTDSKAFRLPTGYRSDTFEVGVEGNVRVRAIHLAETMLGLREV